MTADKAFMGYATYDSLHAMGGGVRECLERYWIRAERMPMENGEGRMAFVWDSYGRDCQPRVKQPKPKSKPRTWKKRRRK